MSVTSLRHSYRSLADTTDQVETASIILAGPSASNIEVWKVVDLGVASWYSCVSREVNDVNILAEAALWVM